MYLKFSISNVGTGNTIFRNKAIRNITNIKKEEILEINLLKTVEEYVNLTEYAKIIKYIGIYCHLYPTTIICAIAVKTPK